MHKFITLVKLELDRNFKPFLFLIAALFVAQLGAAVMKGISTNNIDELIFRAEYNSGIYFIGLAIMLLLAFFIWLRDMKDTMCTLLLLPINRMYIYFAKFITMLFFIYIFKIASMLFQFLSMLYLSKTEKLNLPFSLLFKILGQEKLSGSILGFTNTWLFFLAGISLIFMCYLLSYLLNRFGAIIAFIFTAALGIGLGIIHIILIQTLYVNEFLWTLFSLYLGSIIVALPISLYLFVKKVHV